MGGKSAPAPDYSSMAAASREAAQTAERLGNRQMDFAERQFNEIRPLAQRAADQQFATQNELMQMGREDRQYQIDTFRPLERGLVADAERFSTEGFREQQARDAAAAAGRAFETIQGSTARNLASRGVSMGSGAGLAAMQQNNLGLAAQRANAMTGARNQAEQLGFARRVDVTGLGRGLSGSALGAYGAATGAGSAGVSTAMAPGGQFMQGMGQGASTIGAGRSMLQGGLGNILSSQTTLRGQGMAAEGEMMGAALGIGAAFAGRSDRRLKKNIELVGRDERTGLPLYEFEYKDGDGRVFLGVMADEVEKIYPEAVSQMPNGYMAVNYDMLGIEMMEVQS